MIANYQDHGSTSVLCEARPILQVRAVAIAQAHFCADTPAARLQRLSWAALLARVWQIDADLCPRCGGRMKPVAALTEPASIRHYLAGVGLPTEPPAIAAARPPPQQEFDFVE